MSDLSLNQIISKCKNKRVLLLTHEHADLDSFASARMMQIFLKNNRIKSTLAVPSQINEQTREFARKKKISFISKPDLNKFEVFLLFDLNSCNQLGSLCNFFASNVFLKKFDIIVFDHHESLKGCISYNSDNCVIDSTAHSTTQIIYNLLGDFNTKETFFLNCLGLIEDTGHFLVGSSESFFDFSVSLKKSGASYSDVLEFTKESFDNSQRIALLKSAQRSKIIRVNEVILVTSIVSFHQSFVATKLLNFGAHISLVCGIDRKGICILSARADSVFKDKNNYNLVRDLLIPLREMVGGDVGGHSGAAQWKGDCSPEIVLKNCTELTKNKFFK